jgi:hypothetical protein
MHKAGRDLVDWSLIYAGISKLAVIGLARAQRRVSLQTWPTETKKYFNFFSLTAYNTGYISADGGAKF